ncbi:MAG: hypothetical protein WDN28_32035 [Chthoniobacter sp.]
MRVVKTHAREDYEAERFNKANLQMLKFAMAVAQGAGNGHPRRGNRRPRWAIVGALIYAWANDLDYGRFTALNAGLVLLYDPADDLGPHQYPHAEMPRRDDEGVCLHGPPAGDHRRASGEGAHRADGGNPASTKSPLPITVRMPRR